MYDSIKRLRGQMIHWKVVISFIDHLFLLLGLDLNMKPNKIGIYPVLVFRSRKLKSKILISYSTENEERKSFNENGMS